MSQPCQDTAVAGSEELRFELLGDATPWLNWLGHVESFDSEPDLYEKAMGVNAMVGDRIVGSFVHHCTGFIFHVYVRPEYRNNGLMRRLLAYYEGPRHGVEGSFESRALEAKIRQIIHEECYA